MRVSLSKKRSFLNYLSKKRTSKILLPLFLFTIIFTFALFPNITFASWWNPVDWVRDLISEILIAQATALYFLGFLFVKIGVFFTSYLVGNNAVTDKWKIIRDLALELFGIIIIAIAIMNILRIKIDEWGVNRMIPRLALASLAVIFSKYVCITILNFANAISNAITARLDFNIFQPFDMLGSIFAIYCADCTSGVRLWAAFMALAVAFVAFIFLVILGAVLFIRALFLVFLIIASPLAFALSILPWTTAAFKKWWDMFIKWTFFYPIALLILAIGITLSVSTQKSGYDQLLSFIKGAFIPDFFKDASDQVSILITQWAFTLIALITIPMAIFLPLKLLGSAGGMIGNAIKKTGRAAGRPFGEMATGKRGIPGVKYSPKTARDWLGARGKRRATKNLESLDQLMRSKFGEGFITGYDQQDAMARKKELIKTLGDGTMSKEEKREYAQGILTRANMGHLSPEKQAWLNNFEQRGGNRKHAIDFLAKEGQLNHETADNADVRQYLQKTGDWDTALKESSLHHLRTKPDGSAFPLYEMSSDEFGKTITPNINNLRSAQLGMRHDRMQTTLDDFAANPKSKRAAKDLLNKMDATLGAGVNTLYKDTPQETTEALTPEQLANLRDNADYLRRLV